MFYEHAKASLAALIVLSLGLVAARAGSEGKPEAGQDEARKSAEGDYRRFQESPASPSCRVFLGVHWVFDAFATKPNGTMDLTQSVGGVRLGLDLAENIFAVGSKKAPKKSSV